VAFWQHNAQLKYLCKNKRQDKKERHELTRKTKDGQHGPYIKWSYITTIFSDISKFKVNLKNLGFDETVKMYVVLLEVLLFMPNSLIRHSILLEALSAGMITYLSWREERHLTASFDETVKILYICLQHHLVTVFSTYCIYPVDADLILRRVIYRQLLF
jgi:hypothetical protein